MYIIDIRWHECSNFLNFLSNHDWIITSNFRRAELPIVERAFVLITVSMYRAEETTTSALEAGQSNFLTAGRTSILFLLAVLITVFVVAVGYRGVITRAAAATCSTLIVNFIFIFGTKEHTLDCGLCGVCHCDRWDWGGGGDGGGWRGCGCAGVALRCDHSTDVGGGSGRSRWWRGRTGRYRRTADGWLLLFSERVLITHWT